MKLPNNSSEKQNEQENPGQVSPWLLAISFVFSSSCFLLLGSALHKDPDLKASQVFHARRRFVLEETAKAKSPQEIRSIVAELSLKSDHMMKSSHRTICIKTHSRIFFGGTHSCR